ncbi:MAG TPA: methyl-accepting chemotaxis protein [Desulfotignum sp.]|nr:methyl-accepting chemotaxis protein [Desulfotignum sp.]
MGFGKKLYLGSLGTILITILIIAGMNFFQSKQSFLARGKAGIESVSDVLLKTVETRYALQQDKMTADMGMLVSESQAAGKPMVVEARTVDMQISDVQTQKTATRTIPKLIFGLEFVTGEYSIVDKVGRFSDAEIAIFQMFDNKLIKVSTSNENEDGSRSVGNYYGPDSEVFAAVSAGSSYEMRTGTGKNIALQIFAPFQESIDQKIVGAYSVVSPILTPDLQELVREITVNGKGYCFVADARGRILVHPDAAGVDQKVQDFTNGQAILETEAGFADFQQGDQTYYAFVNYFAPWDLFFVTTVSEAELMAGVNRQIITTAGISGFIALLIGALIIAVMNRQLMTHMKGMADLARAVAEGNFQHTFSYKAQDAIRDTVTSMNDMVAGLAAMVRDLNAGVDTLSGASGELNRISEDMGTGADTSVARVNSVASAAEQMSMNMDSVAAAMEEAATNVKTVSEGTRDMQTSLDRVAENSGKTRDITVKAVDRARLTSERVQKLDRAAEEIDKVTDTIASISSQTNLLALNATIEAARAGDAGKGFAVVANEIKDLASQTAGATEEIAENIREIKEQIQGAVTEIQDISAIINDINQFVGENAQAIASQSDTTRAMTQNIGQVSAGIQEVNENVAQSSQVSGQVASEISDVLTAAENIRSLSDNVKQKAGTLDQVITRLRTMTERFKL